MVHAIPAQRIGEAMPVGLQAAQAGRTDGPWLGRKHIPGIVLPHIERFVAEPVARAKQRTVAPVVDQESPDAIEMLHAVRSPLSVRGEQYLGVAGGTELVAERDEFRAQLDVIVDFAVEDQRQRAVGAGHRLVAALGRVDDRQAPKTESHRTRQILARIVRTAVYQRLGSTANDSGRHDLALASNNCNQSTHGSDSIFLSFFITPRRAPHERGRRAKVVSCPPSLALWVTLSAIQVRNPTLVDRARAPAHNSDRSMICCAFG